MAEEAYESFIDWEGVFNFSEGTLGDTSGGLSLDEFFSTDLDFTGDFNLQEDDHFAPLWDPIIDYSSPIDVSGEPVYSNYYMDQGGALSTDIEDPNAIGADTRLSFEDYGVGYGVLNDSEARPGGILGVMDATGLSQQRFGGAGPSPQDIPPPAITPGDTGGGADKDPNSRTVTHINKDSFGPSFYLGLAGILYGFWANEQKMNMDEELLKLQARYRDQEREDAFAMQQAGFRHQMDLARLRGEIQEGLKSVPGPAVRRGGFTDYQVPGGLGSTQPVEVSQNRVGSSSAVSNQAETEAQIDEEDAYG